MRIKIVLKKWSNRLYLQTHEWANRLAQSVFVRQVCTTALAKGAILILSLAAAAQATVR